MTEAAKTRPIIFLVNRENGHRYKILHVDKVTKVMKLFSENSGSTFETHLDKMSNDLYSVVNEGVEVVPTTPEQPEADLVASTPEAAPEAVAPTTAEIVEEAVAGLDMVVTNRKEALAVSNAYKRELRPILARMKLVEANIGLGHKGEAKKIAYIIQWAEKYLAE